MEELKQRVDKLEIRVTLLEKDVEGINKKLDKIDSNISKLTWIVISAVLMALLNAMLKGGVNL